MQYGCPLRVFSVKEESALLLDRAIKFLTSSKRAPLGPKGRDLNLWERLINTRAGLISLWLLFLANFPFIEDKKISAI